jgi:hypothetical protein
MQHINEKYENEVGGKSLMKQNEEKIPSVQV